LKTFAHLKSRLKNSENLELIDEPKKIKQTVFI